MIRSMNGNYEGKSFQSIKLFASRRNNSSLKSFSILENSKQALLERELYQDKPMDYKKRNREPNLLLLCTLIVQYGTILI